MDSIAQRLKELPREQFEMLCFHLLKDRHPGADVRHVEGASGDLGADMFAGDLDADPVIWQAKAFPNGIGESQKEQIRCSLRRAVQALSPRLWALCISVDMDIHAHRWFQRLAKSYAPRVDVRLMQASDIVSELMHRKTLRDHFFPGAALSVSELRSLVTKTGDCSDAEVAALTEENALQYIERLKQRDARFNYEIVVASDRTASGALPMSGASFSIRKGATAINAYPRDLEALRSSPPKVSLRFTDSGVAKIQDFVDTGRAQSFVPAEVALNSTDLPFFGPDFQAVTVGPSRTKEPLSARLTFGSGSHAVVYDLIQFVVERIGQQEAELVSTGRHPFTLSLILRRGDGTLNITERLAGASFVAVDKYLSGVVALQETRELEVYDLERERPFFRAEIQAALPPTLNPRMVQFIRDGAQIARAFCSDLAVPPSITQQDAETFEILKGLQSGTVDGIENVSGTIMKEGDEGRWLGDLAAGVPISVRLPHPGMVLMFAGTAISTGPFTLIFDQVSLDEPSEALARWRQLPIGSVMQVLFKPVTAPRAIREPHEAVNT